MKKYYDINGKEVKVGDKIRTIAHEEEYIVRQSTTDKNTLYPAFILMIGNFEIIESNGKI